MTISFFVRHYIKRAYYNKFVLLDYAKKREIILGYKKKYNSDVLVETGTFLGDTASVLKEDFSKIYTIELHSELANRAKERFEKEINVEVIEGDSSSILVELTGRLATNTLFWLDAHYSSKVLIKGDYFQTAKADKDTPIVEELEIILKNGLENNVILIDDARCFTGENDYPKISTLKQFLNKKGISNTQIAVKNDIIRIVPAITK